MRSAGFVHERHLNECVRRGVITADQMEQVLAVTRSMARAEGDARPDFTWVTGMHVACAAGAIVATMVILHRAMCDMDLAQIAGYSFAVAAAMLGVAALLRRFANARAPAAVLAAGASWAMWGVGAALGCVVAGLHGLTTYGDPTVGYESAFSRLQLATMVGDAAVILAAIVLGWRKRIAVTALAGALAAVHLGMTIIERWHDARAMSFGELQASPFLVAFAVVLTVAAYAIDRRTRGSRYDVGFWFHLTALATLGFAAFVRSTHYPGDEGMLWGCVSAAVGILGLAFERRIYLAASAAGVLAFPLCAVWDTYLSHMERPFALFGSTVVIGLLTALWRRRALTSWAAATSPTVERTVWE